MYFVSACAMSMYSCEVRVGDIKEMPLAEKNGEKAVLTSIKKLRRSSRPSLHEI